MTLTPTEVRMRQAYKKLNKFMVFMFKIRLGWMLNIWPAGGGRFMVIQHTGRKSGRVLHVPVNYAMVDGEIYCTSGFGSVAHWYRNLLANPEVELWLPGKKILAVAEDISESPKRLHLMRAVLIGSGFAAGLLAGINTRKDSDERIDKLTKTYRLLHFQQVSP